MADAIPRAFIELLLTRIDLVDLINTEIPLGKKSGSNYFARCPFHNEKSASFSVSQPKQFYYCFGCGAHGNAIDFLIQYSKLTFKEAIQNLAQQVGMEVPQTSAPVSKDPTLPALYELMTHITTYYYQIMRKSPRAIDYLKSRGISGETAQQFQLGYAEQAWATVLDQFGKTDEQKKRLLDAGLIIKKQEGGYYDRFRDRIIFPIQDYRGRWIGFGGRILDQGEPKYLNSPETPLFQKGRELYGLYQVIQCHRELKRVVIVEGYMDVIALFQHGITYAVATLGTATTPHHLQRLFRYTTEIVFCFDGDEAGRLAAWRALLVLLPLLQDHIQIRFLFLPEGEDPDSLVRKEGSECFEQRIQTALSLSSFFFQRLSQQNNISTMEGRAAFAASALGHIKSLPPGLFQGILLEELSKRTRIEVAELKEQLRTGELSPAADPLTSTQKTSLKMPSPLRLALALIIQHPSLASRVPSPLPVLNLPGLPFLEQIVEKIGENPSITTGHLLEHWRDQKEGALIAKLAQWEHLVPETGLEEEFEGALRQLILLGFDSEINRLLAKASGEGLNEDEKRELSIWIARKKSYPVHTPMTFSRD